MKLYATTTSERASKGQGGNEYIISEFSVDREIIGQVELYLYNDAKHHGTDTDEWTLKFRNGGDDDDNDWDILAQGYIPNKLATKGKKQKGEGVECPQCGQVSKTNDPCPKCGFNAYY